MCMRKTTERYTNARQRGFSAKKIKNRWSVITYAWKCWIRRRTGNIVRILPRKNELVRPAVANIDQALVIFAIVKPEPNYNLLDRFLIMMEQQGLSSILCFNKKDIASEEEQKALREAYGFCGSRILFSSASRGDGMEELEEVLKGKTTAVAGPSGAGKSSIINRLNPDAGMETGEISKKIGRGSIRRDIRKSLLYRKILLLWTRQDLLLSACSVWIRRTCKDIILNSSAIRSIAASPAVPT